MKESDGSAQLQLRLKQYRAIENDIFKKNINELK